MFYKHLKKPFYEEIYKYMLSDECVLMLLCHEKENPIEKWKKMIGPMDPVDAKV